MDLKRVTVTVQKPDFTILRVILASGVTVPVPDLIRVTVTVPVIYVESQSLFQSC